ncbi:hypothetical protein [Rhizobium chutanense]|uniref:hypothetical protein n=1 Tax=Rhizobium chutanense TaxID=2035448 RepID=UPI000F869911|nr:hypothetical protein [Rhizobium chutanense]
MRITQSQIDIVATQGQDSLIAKNISCKLVWKSEQTPGEHKLAEFGGALWEVPAGVVFATSTITIRALHFS